MFMPIDDSQDGGTWAFRELHSAISDIVARIGIASKPDWIRKELENVLNETKFKHLTQSKVSDVN